MKTFPAGIAFGALSTLCLAQAPSVLDPLANAAASPGHGTAASRLPPTVELRLGRVPIHTAEPDAGRQYGIWAAAESYKVGFHGDMTFVPYLGTASARNRSLSWRTVSVRSGGVELLEPAEQPRRWHADFRYEYRYGVLTEAYDVLEDGLEQTFVLQAPAGSGDLVVTGRIATDLVAEQFTGEHRRIGFVDENGIERIAYGAATVVDASGNTAAIATSVVGDRVALTVPGDWLAAAAYPVTIDPLLTAQTITGGFRHFSTDVTRDDSQNQIMVVHTRGASEADQDLYAYIQNDDWSTRTVVFTDVTASWSTDHGRCAVAANPQKYCVVFERHLTVGHRIRYHMHDSGDLTLSTSVVGINVPTGEHHWRPDIGGHVVPSGLITPLTGTDFLLVYQREDNGSSTFGNTARSSIRARLIASNGTFGSEWIVQSSTSLGSLDYERPSVNQQALRPAGGTTTWMVVFQGYNNNIVDDDWDVFGRLVNNQGQTESGIWVAPGNDIDSDHRLAPQVAGQSGRYLVAYTQRPPAVLTPKPSVGNGSSLVLGRVDWSPGGNPNAQSERTLYGPFGNNRMELGSCAFDHETDSHWVVQSASLASSGGTGRTILDRVGYTGAVTESVTLEAAGSGEQGIPGGATYDDDNDTFVVSWIMNGASSGFGRANKLDYVTPLSPAVQGTGCSSSTIGWSGSTQIGSEFGSIFMSAGPGNQLAFLLFALNTRNQDLTPIGMPGCFLLVQNSGPSYLGAVVRITSASGFASVPLPLPEWLSPAILYFQWFHIEPNANAMNILTTQRLRVQIVK